MNLIVSQSDFLSIGDAEDIGAPADVCPLCSGIHAIVVERSTAATCARLWSSADKRQRLAAHLEKLWCADSVLLIRCTDCDLVRASPFVAGDHEFYDMTLGENEYPSEKWEFERTLTALASLNLSGPVLDFGAGNGGFIRRLFPLFRKEQITAVEINPGGAAQIRGDGYRVVDSIAALAGERFAAAFMFQVLEHCDHPVETVGAIAHLLSPGGHLFVAVPNPEAEQFAAGTGAVIAPPPAHISRWSIENLRALGRIHGLEAVEAEAEPFSMASFIANDCFYSYLRAAQRSDGLLAWLYAHRRDSRAMRLLNLAAIVARVPLRLRTWVRGLRCRAKLGRHIWVHLRKHG